MVLSSNASSARSKLRIGASSFIANTPLGKHPTRANLSGQVIAALWGCQGDLFRLVRRPLTAPCGKRSAGLIAAKRHRISKAVCRMQVERDLGDLAGVEAIDAAHFDSHASGLDAEL